MKQQRQNINTLNSAVHSSENDRVIDMLLDRKSRTVVLFDESGDKHTYKKIAAVPYKSESADILYIIMRPLDGPFEIADDEAYAFRLGAGDRGEVRLFLETNERKAAEVFEGYFAMLDGARVLNNGRKGE